MSPVAELERALDSPHPLVSLREKVISVMDEEGLSDQEMLEALRMLRAQFRAEGKVRHEDAVLEAMDFVAGWCSPHMKLHRA